MSMLTASMSTAANGAVVPATVAVPVTRLPLAGEVRVSVVAPWVLSM